MVAGEMPHVRELFRLPWIDALLHMASQRRRSIRPLEVPAPCKRTGDANLLIDG
jgi:hypothetical protein